MTLSIGRSYLPWGGGEEEGEPSEEDGWRWRERWMGWAAAAAAGEAVRADGLGEVSAFFFCSFSFPDESVVVRERHGSFWREAR